MHPSSHPVYALVWSLIKNSRFLKYSLLGIYIQLYTIPLSEILGIFINTYKLVYTYILDMIKNIVFEDIQE